MRHLIRQNCHWPPCPRPAIDHRHRSSNVHGSGNCCCCCCCCYVAIALTLSSAVSWRRAAAARRLWLLVATTRLRVELPPLLPRDWRREEPRRGGGVISSSLDCCVSDESDAEPESSSDGGACRRVARRDVRAPAPVTGLGFAPPTLLRRPTSCGHNGARGELAACSHAHCDTACRPHHCRPSLHTSSGLGTCFSHGEPTPLREKRLRHQHTSTRAGHEPPISAPHTPHCTTAQGCDALTWAPRTVEARRLGMVKRSKGHKNAQPEDTQRADTSTLDTGNQTNSGRQKYVFLCFRSIPPPPNLRDAAFWATVGGVIPSGLSHE